MKYAVGMDCSYLQKESVQIGKMIQFTAFSAPSHFANAFYIKAEFQAFSDFVKVEHHPKGEVPL